MKLEMGARVNMESKDNDKKLNIRPHEKYDRDWERKIVGPHTYM